MEHFDSLIIKITLIGVLGIGAQWVAWRTGRPAIALMLIAGIVAGPILGLINPEDDFGELLQPVIKLAVAVILFEGGLSLNFRDLKHAGWGVLRLVLIGGPLSWALGTAAAHYGAGLSLPVSALFGGILVVTGPTVIGPMLRNLNVGPRVRDMLKWEGIINDPIGALLAVAIYAYITFEGGPAATISQIGFNVAGASFIAALIGVGLAYFLLWLFPRGLAPEYLKAPLLLITVIFGFVLADIVMHETGLITVTVMGMVMANKPVYSSRALHRFKEDLAVLLISGVFIILSATLDWATVQAFQARFIIFLLLLLFIVRPVAVLVSLLFSSIPWRERAFLAWIAPRGIVAVAITGLFAIRMQEQQIPDAEALVPLSFGVVIATIFAHGFSASWFARWLGIDQGKGTKVMIVGANSWTVEFASFLKDNKIDVTIADIGKFALRAARRQDIRTFNADILEEALDDNIDLGQYQHMIVATDNESYNQLVCSDLGPEMGYDLISQVALDDQTVKRGESRGRVLFEGDTTYADLIDRTRSGWRFSKTRLTEKFGYEEFKEKLDPGEEAVAVLKPNGKMLFFARTARPSIEDGDEIISFVEPETPEERKAQREERAERQETSGKPKPA